MMYDLHEFLSPVNLASLNDDIIYNNSQLANIIKVYDAEMPDLTGTNIVIVGINEFRGAGFIAKENAANAIRRQLYQLHYWHRDVTMADVGNVECGASLADSYAALKTVVAQLLQLNKTVIIIG